VTSLLKNSFSPLSVNDAHVHHAAHSCLLATAVVGRMRNHEKICNKIVYKFANRQESRWKVNFKRFLKPLKNSF